MAPVIGGIIAFALALGLCVGLVAMGQKVFPSSDPRGVRIFRQYLPAGVGGSATFFAFQRVPMNIKLRESTTETVNSRFEDPERADVRIVISPIGGLLLVGATLAIGGNLAWRLRGRRNDRLLPAAATMAVVFGLACLVFSTILPLEQTVLERGAFSRRSTHVAYAPSHLGAFVWPLVWGFLFGLLGMHTAKHGRSWRKALVANAASRSPMFGDALRAAASGLAVGALLVVVAGVATGAVAIVQHPTGAGDVLGSGKNIAGLAEGAVLGLPHATGAGLIGAMGVPARFETSANDGDAGTSGSAGIFGVTSSQDFGSNAIAVPRYALGALGIAAISTFVAGFRAAASGERRRALRTVAVSAGLQTIFLWTIAYLAGGEGRIVVGIDRLSEDRAEIGASLPAILVLPIAWTFGGGSLGALARLAGGRVPARAPRRVVVAGALFALAAIGTGFAVSNTLVDEQPSVTVGADGWNVYTDPSHGWTLEFPASWHVQPILESKDGVYTMVIQGVFVSNVDRRFEQPPVGPNEWTSRFDMRGLPADAAVLQVAFRYGGGFTVHCPNSPLPLSLVNAKRSTTNDGAGGATVTVLDLPFVAQSVPYYGLTAWIGPEATEADRKILERMVASISFDKAEPGPEPQTTELCRL